MALLKVGDKVPDFSCYDDKENLITNEFLKGKKTIIFFFPRARSQGHIPNFLILKDTHLRTSSSVRSWSFS